MNGKDFSEVVDLIVKEDARYDKGAYFFVRKALDHTLRARQEDRHEGASRHVSGQQLLKGIREYALEQFGPMTIILFSHWGVGKCADFGEIVFNLVEYGVFGKTDDDSKNDFVSGYSFRRAFLVPYLPRAKLNPGVDHDDSQE